jgi:hypothetical protein
VSGQKITQKYSEVALENPLMIITRHWGAFWTRAYFHRRAVKQSDFCANIRLRDAREIYFSKVAQEHLISEAA